MSAPDVLLERDDAQQESRREVRVRCACVTTWPEELKGPRALHNLCDSPEEQELLRMARARKAPVWIEIELDPDSDPDALKWYEPTMEPWDETRQPVVRWSDIEDELRLLGIPLPPGRQGAGDTPVADVPLTCRVLDALPLVYALGIRRTLAELKLSEGSAEAYLFPIVGFQKPVHENRLCSHMLRVSAGVVGKRVITLRLRDEKWPVSGGTEFPPREATLEVRKRFIPTPEQPTPAQIAESIALFQVETCGAVLNRGRNWLGKIEALYMESPTRAAERLASSGSHSTMNGNGPATGEPAVNPLEPAELKKNFDQLFRLGVRAEQMERELARVVERYNLDEAESGRVTRAVQQRYEDKLAEVRSFQTELRQRCDGISSMVSNQQFAVADQQQENTERFQRRASVVGAAVLIPALVAGVFGANVELPGKDEVRGLVAMIFFMVGLGAGTWWGIDWLDKRGKRTCENFWTPQFAHTHAGFVVAVVALFFGIVTLTPAVGSNLSGDAAAQGIAGVLLLALGLGVAVWCWVNAGRAGWWQERVVPPRLTTAGCVVGPAVAIASVVLLVPALF